MAEATPEPAAAPEPLGDVPYGRCPVCGYLTLPVLELSPCGHDPAPVVAPMIEPGIVYSWTKVGRPGEQAQIAMADFFDGRLRVTAPVLGNVDVAVGDPVRVIPGETTPYALVRGD